MVLTMENPLHNATIDDVDDNCDVIQVNFAVNWEKKQRKKQTRINIFVLVHNKD
jgi:hypothetical protein